MAAKLMSAPAPPDLSSLCHEHAPSPMAMVDGASHIVRYLNPAFCRMIDKTEDEFVGKPFGESLPKKGEAVRRWDGVTARENPKATRSMHRLNPIPFSGLVRCGR